MTNVSYSLSENIFLVHERLDHQYLFFFRRNVQLTSYKQHSAFVCSALLCDFPLKNLKQEAYESRKGVNNLFIIKIPDFRIAARI